MSDDARHTDEAPPSDALIEFRDAHAKGMDALRRGDYDALSEAIGEEASAIDRQAVEIEGFAAAARQIAKARSGNVPEGMSTGDLVITPGAERFVVRRYSSPGGTPTYTDVAGYRLRDDAQAAACALCSAGCCVWLADADGHLTRVHC